MRSQKALRFSQNVDSQFPPSYLPLLAGGHRDGEIPPSGQAAMVFCRFPKYGVDGYVLRKLLDFLRI